MEREAIVGRPRKFKRLTVKFLGSQILPPEMQKWHDVVNHIQHIILSRWAMKLAIGRHAHRREGRYWHESHPDHVAMPWEIMATLYGKRAASAVMKFLLDEGYLERLDHYDLDVHAYGYKFGPRTEGAPNRRVYLTTEWLDERLKVAERANHKNWSKGYVHLKKWLPRFQYDVRGMYEVMRGDRAEDHMGIVIEMMAEGDYNARSCRYGRFHSVITCLKSVLRGSITYNGEHLWNIDIANSQPFILGAVVMDALKSGQVSSSPDETSDTPESIYHHPDSLRARA